MSPIFILIWVVGWGAASGSVATGAQEFTSREQCELARTAFSDNYGRNIRMLICVRK